MSLTDPTPSPDRCIGLVSRGSAFRGRPLEDIDTRGHGIVPLSLVYFPYPSLGRETAWQALKSERNASVASNRANEGRGIRGWRRDPVVFI